jgi:formylglycine-generating enzyme required for sulfatase activity
MWSVDAWAKPSTLTHKQISTKKKVTTTTTTKTKTGIKTKINPKDGAEMILIPAGDFLMGSTDADKNAQDYEKPQHKVYLDAYYMYKTEVTVMQYRKFCTATGRKMPNTPDWGWKVNHPIVNVTWNDAKAYADWAGAILPTEAQWEKAARGTDGRIYPWGTTWDETKCANYTNSGKDNTTKGTHPVGSFPTGASPYGVMDMSGNVYEWCSDWYGADYYKNTPAKNPTGPITGNWRVLRGGSWISPPIGCRGAYRGNDDPTCYYGYYGFRCASPEPLTPLIDAPAVAPVTQLPKTKINPKDGAEMILIPAGNFLMGTSEEELTNLLKANIQYQRGLFTCEMPQHEVYIDAYYMYKTEITVAQYRKFCTVTGREMPQEAGWKWQDTHPIVDVNWDDAKAYADWAGVALPSEAQWEKAARGEDGRIYPWGNTWDKTKCANGSNSGNGNTTWGTHPVGSFPTGASPYGVMDMSGNVWEWCADWYKKGYDTNAPAKNPTGPVTGNCRVLRGGSWGDYGYYGYGLRGAYRNVNYPVYGRGGNTHIGFRCASPGQ